MTGPCQGFLHNRSRTRISTITVTAGLRISVILELEQHEQASELNVCCFTPQNLARLSFLLHACGQGHRSTCQSTCLRTVFSIFESSQTHLGAVSCWIPTPTVFKTLKGATHKMTQCENNSFRFWVALLLSTSMLFQVTRINFFHLVTYPNVDCKAHAVTGDNGSIAEQVPFIQTGPNMERFKRVRTNLHSCQGLTRNP